MGLTDIRVDMLLSLWSEYILQANFRKLSPARFNG